MKDRKREISLCVDEKELALLQEACEHGGDIDENIEDAVEDAAGYRIYFSCEELEDLADAVAGCSNH